ncbi:Modification methylase HaeIII [compost metagenome]
MQRAVLTDSVIPVLSLFSGGGLLDLGFLNKGFQIERAIEINSSFIEGYNYAFQKYFESSANYYIKKGLIKHRNIESPTDASDKKNQIKLQKEYKNISGIIGGPPCQDYSVGGKNKGIDGERGKLIISYLGIVKRLNPDFIFFENVEGLYKTKNHYKGFQLLINGLEQYGYCLWFDIINPINYGFPQDRPRIIVVGFKNRIVKKLVKNGYLLEKDNEVLKNTNSENYIFRWPQIKLQNPKLIQWPTKWSFGSDVNLDELRNIPKMFEALQVINVFQGLHSGIPNQNDCFTPKSAKFTEIEEGDTNRKSFKRLHRYRYSPTVAYGNNEVHLHPTKPRRLTVREALRIQTVPDNYILPSDLTLTAKYKIISNGVPTAQAELIAEEIRRTLINYYLIK